MMLDGRSLTHLRRPFHRTRTGGCLRDRPQTRTDRRMSGGGGRELRDSACGLVDGFVTTQLLFVAATSTSAGLLAGRPMTVETWRRDRRRSRRCTRVLRDFAAEDVLAGGGRRRFASRRSGSAWLAAGGRRSPGATLLPLRVRASWTPCATAARRSSTSTARRSSTTSPRHPDRERVPGVDGGAGRAGGPRRRRPPTTSRASAALVDVGGGSGPARRDPPGGARPGGRASGPRGARPRPGATGRDGVGDRAECVAGTSSPRAAGGDGYLLSRVLHDWDDADAARILASAAPRWPPAAGCWSSRRSCPNGPATRLAVIRMDLHMLMLFGRERTEESSGRLLAGAGFAVRGSCRPARPPDSA